MRTQSATHRLETVHARTLAGLTKIERKRAALVPVITAAYQTATADAQTAQAKLARVARAARSAHRSGDYVRQMKIIRRLIAE